MNNELKAPQDILLRHISGFHQYCLTPPARPTFVSRNLCQMLCLPQEALLHPAQDLYARQVHPGDQAAYADFLEALGREEQTLTLQYRLIRQDGSIISVSDTMTSYRQDGALVGDSVLTDITQLKDENQNLRFLNETMPCGFLKYTCEKTPRITYINDQMLRLLRFPAGSARDTGTLEMYLQNIYMMIPMEERSRFARYLERVYAQGAPLAGEMTALRCDGTKAYLFGWVTKTVNAQGEEEFQSACMDVTERHQQRQRHEASRYLKALTEVYDTILEYDLSSRTVKCLHEQDPSIFRGLENVPMQMEEATEKWITGTACESDRERLQAFFRDFGQGNFPEPDAHPPQITYRTLSSAGGMKTCNGVFLRLDGAVSLYCCRNVPQSQEDGDLRSENAALKNMQDLVMRFTEGVVAFEVENGTVKPLYVSENVCSFFGYSREEWVTLAKTRPTIQDFISQSGVAYADIQKLFAAGEAEFSYFDMTQNAYRRIKAICSQIHPGSGKCYVMLYNMDARDREASGAQVRIRTFGYFDVFVDDKPIAFRNEKSKELFALLVDRRGGFVSSEEAISFLWEDEPANSVTLARYRKVALRLKNILEEYGIPDIIESVNGKRRLITERVQCDLYDYLSGKEEHAQLFKGSYLNNYSWGENTLAELTGDHLYGTGK